MGPDCPTRAAVRSSLQPAGTCEQLVACVQRRIVHNSVEQRVERASERRALGEPEPDEIRAVDGEVLQTVRLRALAPEELAQARGRVQLGVRNVLPAEVGLLVRDEVERKLVAVLAQEATGKPLVDPSEREC